MLATRSRPRPRRSVSSPRRSGWPRQRRSSPGSATSGLTPTEERVAELIASGMTYREAADALFISPKTVQWNVSNVYRKLGVRSGTELAALLATRRAPAAEDPSTE